MGGYKLSEYIFDLLMLFGFFNGISQGSIAMAIGGVFPGYLLREYCCRATFYHGSPDKLGKNEIKQAFSNRNISVIWIDERKKERGYLYFVVISKDDIGQVPEGWVSYKGQDLSKEWGK